MVPKYCSRDLVSPRACQRPSKTAKSRNYMERRSTNMIKGAIFLHKEDDMLDVSQRASSSCGRDGQKAC